MKLKAFYLMIMLFIVNLNVLYAQYVEEDVLLTAKEQRKLEKKKAKEEKKKAKELAKQQEKEAEKSRYLMAKTAMKNQKFVLQANQVYNRYGQVAQVTNSINFVKLDSNYCVVQLAFDGMIGFNGLGGITLDGKISNLEYKENENGGILMTFNVQGIELQANVRILLNGADNWADATVRSQTRNLELNFRGNIIPTNLSSVFQGNTPF